MAEITAKLRKSLLTRLVDEDALQIASLLQKDPYLCSGQERTIDGINYFAAFPFTSLFIIGPQVQNYACPSHSNPTEFP